MYTYAFYERDKDLASAQITEIDIYFLLLCYNGSHIYNATSSSCFNIASSGDGSIFDKDAR